MDLEIDIVNKKEKSIIYLFGEIDLYTAPKLKKAILPLTEKSGYQIVVDFDEVNYMDSTGLGVFISVLKSTKEHDSHFKIINLDDKVFRLFKITGLDEIIEVHSKSRSEVE